MDHPPKDHVKVNINGSYFEDSDSMGTGFLIRSEREGWDLGFSSYEGTGDPLLAELLPMKNGLLLEWKRGFRRVFCESDSLEANQGDIPSPK